MNRVVCFAHRLIEHLPDILVDFLGLLYRDVARYVEERYTVQVTVEDELRSELIEQLLEDLTQRLETLEQSLMVCQGITAE